MSQILAVVLRLAAGLLLAALFATPAANTLTPEEQAQGWELLFDGASLSAWEQPLPGPDGKPIWVIEDGCLVAKPFEGPSQYLLTREKYDDFEFSFEWRMSPNGNSGVKYLIQKYELRVDGKPVAREQVRPGMKVNEWLAGFEYQLIDDERHRDAKEPRNTSGSIYNLVAPASRAARPAGEFNHSRLIVRGNSVEHWLNGVNVVSVSLDSDEFRKVLKERWEKRRPGSYRALATRTYRIAPLALQNHGDTPVWFRNLKIRRLQSGDSSGFRF